MEYKDAKAKYKLPEIFEIDREFDVLPMEDVSLPVKHILKKIIEKIETAIKVLEDILQPEFLHSMYEANAFDEDEKEKIFELYKKLMILHRKSSQLFFDYNETESAKLINEILGEWKTIKTEIRKILKKLEDSWKHDFNKETKVGYLR